MDYPNDDKLLMLIARHNIKARDMLVRRYDGFIRAWAANFCAKNKGLDYNELVMAGMGSFFESLSTYNPYKGNLYKFIYTVVHHKFVNVLKESAFNNKTYLYSKSMENSDTFLYLKEDEPVYKTTRSMYEDLASKFDNFNFLDQQLKDILFLKLKKKTNKEIAETLNISLKKVDNSFQEIKRRMKSYKDNYYK